MDDSCHPTPARSTSALPSDFRSSTQLKGRSSVSATSTAASRSSAGRSSAPIALPLERGCTDKDTHATSVLPHVLLFVRRNDAALGDFLELRRVHLIVLRWRDRGEVHSASLQVFAAVPDHAQVRVIGVVDGAF